jgi:hypothetical protein
MVASAALVFSTSCAQQQPVKPIEIKGPLVDTPQSYTPFRGVKKAMTPPVKDAPAIPGSTTDLENRISKIHEDIRTLDDALKPRPDGQDK